MTDYKPEEGYPAPECGVSDTSSLLPPGMRPPCKLTARHSGPHDWHPLFAIRESIEHYEGKRVFDAMMGIGNKEFTAEQAAAACSWIKSGELSRHYGPAMIIGYSLNAMARRSKNAM